MFATVKLQRQTLKTLTSLLCYNHSLLKHSISIPNVESHRKYSVFNHPPSFYACDFDELGFSGFRRWLSTAKGRSMRSKVERRMQREAGKSQCQICQAKKIKLKLMTEEERLIYSLQRPAFYEAFGLTVVEAMTCGLPTFATFHGGPSEIIEDGISGFHFDPYHADQAAEKMVAFFEKCKKDPSYWTQISNAGLQRIKERYTWKKYSERLMTLAGAKSVPQAIDDEPASTDAVAKSG